MEALFSIVLGIIHDCITMFKHPKKVPVMSTRIPLVKNFGKRSPSSTVPTNAGRDVLDLSLKQPWSVGRSRWPFLQIVFALGSPSQTDDGNAAAFSLM